jgi:hypothetical protein
MDGSLASNLLPFLFSSSILFQFHGWDIFLPILVDEICPFRFESAVHCKMETFRVYGTNFLTFKLSQYLYQSPDTLCPLYFTDIKVERILCSFVSAACEVAIGKSIYHQLIIYPP